MLNRAAHEPTRPAGQRKSIALQWIFRENLRCTGPTTDEPCGQAGLLGVKLQPVCPARQYSPANWPSNPARLS